MREHPEPDTVCEGKKRMEETTFLHICAEDIQEEQTQNGQGWSSVGGGSDRRGKEGEMGRSSSEEGMLVSRDIFSNSHSYDSGTVSCTSERNY